MPTYEYECEKCCHSFEKLFFEENNVPVKCPKCGHSRAKKLVCSDSFMSSASIGACSINAPKGFT